MISIKILIAYIYIFANIFLSYNAYSLTCSEIISKYFNKQETKIISLKDFNDDPVKYGDLFKKIDKEFRRKARKNQLSRKDIKTFTPKAKEKYLLMLGVVFSQNAKGNYQKNTKKSLDTTDFDLFKLLRLKKIDINNIQKIVFDYPESEKIKIKIILEKHIKGSVKDHYDTSFTDILHKLSQNNGKRIYNSEIWNFFAHDWSSPVESVVKHYMTKALESSKLGIQIKSRLKTIEDTIKKEIEKAIDAIPADTKYKKGLKKYLKLYLSLAVICKGINFSEILLNIAKDMNAIVGNIEDPIKLREKLAKLKETTMEDIKKSVLSYIPKKSDLIKGRNSLVETITHSIKTINKDALLSDCAPPLIGKIQNVLKNVEGTKKKLNEIANIFSGKYLHDMFKANRNTFSESDCTALYIDQSKKVISNVAKLMFIEEMSKTIPENTK